MEVVIPKKRFIPDMDLALPVGVKNPLICILSDEST